MSADTRTPTRILPAALVEALWSARGAIRQNARARIWRDTTAARRVRAATIDAVLDAQHRQIFLALGKPGAGAPARSGRAGAPAPLRGRRDVIFSVSSAAFREFVDCAREQHRRMGGESDALLDVVRVVAEACDEALQGFAWDRPTEVAQIRSNSAPLTQLARMVLLGGMISADIRAQATLFAIDIDREYLAFRARGSSGQQDLAADLVEAVSRQVGNGVVVDMDGDVAGFLADPPPRVRSCVVGLGPLRPLDRMAESFQMASRALEVIQAFGLSGAHSFDRLGLLPAVLSDMDTADALRRRFLRPWQDNESQPKMLDTIRAYFACGMDTDRAAGKLLLHPNTLRYRINKFEQLTGVSLCNPAEAMQVWWALQAESVAEVALSAGMPG